MTESPHGETSSAPNRSSGIVQSSVVNQRYRIEGSLGKGGQGDVLLAHDLKLGRKVALKLLNVTESIDQQADGALRREALVMARFHHANVVSIYDYDTWTEQRRPFLVMEFLDGQTVDKLIDQLSNSEIELLVRQVGDALQHAHEIGLVHRDLKPANLMLVDRGRASQRFMLLDLGIAKLMNVSETSATAFQGITYSGAGTPSYMAPEQAQAKPVDFRADIYSMGSLMYELYSGQTPFAGHSDSLRDLLNAIVEERPVPVQSIATRSCPPKLNELVMECLAKDPAERPQSMQELLSRFDQSTNQIKAASSVSEREGSDSVQASSDSARASSESAQPSSEKAPASSEKAPASSDKAPASLVIGGEPASDSPPPIPESATLRPEGTSRAPGLFNQHLPQQAAVVTSSHTVDETHRQAWEQPKNKTESKTSRLITMLIFGFLVVATGTFLVAVAINQPSRDAWNQRVPEDESDTLEEGTDKYGLNIRIRDTIPDVRAPRPERAGFGTFPATTMPDLSRSRKGAVGRTAPR